MSVAVLLALGTLRLLMNIEVALYEGSLFVNVLHDYGLNMPGLLGLLGFLTYVRTPAGSAVMHRTNSASARRARQLFRVMSDVFKCLCKPLQVATSTRL